MAAQRFNLDCRCGDSDCSDTFGVATRGQDRSRCCQYCGWFDCDVCGWRDPSLDQGITMSELMKAVR